MIPPLSTQDASRTPVPDIRIHRPHQLGLEAARDAARLWSDKAARKLDMQCRYEQGPAQDTVHFSRSGIQGTLQVCADQFLLQAELGFLFKAFKQRIEAEIHGQFDALLPRVQLSDSISSM